eukprot:2978309-Amphidinium_carterae.1
MAERPQRRHSTRSWSALRVRCSGGPAPKDLPLTGCARDRPMVTVSVSGWRGATSRGCSSLQRWSARTPWAHRAWKVEPAMSPMGSRQF